MINRMRDYALVVSEIVSMFVVFFAIGVAIAGVIATFNGGIVW